MLIHSLREKNLASSSSLGLFLDLTLADKEVKNRDLCNYHWMLNNVPNTVLNAFNTWGDLSSHNLLRLNLVLLYKRGTGSKWQRQYSRIGLSVPKTYEYTPSFPSNFTDTFSFDPPNNPMSWTRQISTPVQRNRDMEKLSNLPKVIQPGSGITRIRVQLDSHSPAVFLLHLQATTGINLFQAQRGKSTN